MEDYHTWIGVVCGLIAMIVASIWLSRITKPKDLPTQISEEQQDALELIRSAMIKGYKIQSHIRITNEDGMDVFFRLECPDKVKVECKKVTLRSIKNKL